MLTRISADQLNWFRSWIESDDNVLPFCGFARRIVVLHPGTALVDDERFPFQSPTIDPADQANDERLSREQTSAIDRILLEHSGPNALCSFALYAGFLDETSQGRSDGFDEPVGTWYLGRLNYVLLEAELHESAFTAIDQRWGDAQPFIPGKARPFVDLSYLWANDRSWFLASTSDTNVTVIGCDDQLAERLLSEPGLDAHEWK